MTLPNTQTHADPRQDAFLAAAARLKCRPSATDEGGLRMPAAPPEMVRSERQLRSLQTCHRPSLEDRPRRVVRSDSRAYVPELAARIEDDPNLTDGARRCARKLAEETYRRNRQGRELAVTVTYLAKALGRCRRTVQRYLRQLEREGYIGVEIVVSQRARMCVGLVVRLMAPLFAAHHRGRWPGSLANPGATPTSLNQSKGYLAATEKYRTSVQSWALRCMDGVFRSFMETAPLSGKPNPS